MIQFTPLGLNFNELIPSIVGIAGTIILALMLIALGAFAYKSLTGGVEWPDEKEDDPTHTKSRRPKRRMGLLLTQ